MKNQSDHDQLEFKKALIEFVDIKHVELLPELSEAQKYIVSAMYESVRESTCEEFVNIFEKQVNKLFSDFKEGANKVIKVSMDAQREKEKANPEYFKTRSNDIR